MSGLCVPHSIYILGFHLLSIHSFISFCLCLPLSRDREKELNFYHYYYL